MRRDKGLDILLSLNGIYRDKGGYWHKIEVSLTKPTVERPHGISYCLTLHDRSNKRIFGIDNAHAPKTQRKGYRGRIMEYDHIHKSSKDTGTPYSFKNAEQLLTDFYKRVNEIVEGES